MLTCTGGAVARGIRRGFRGKGSAGNSSAGKGSAGNSSAGNSSAGNSSAGNSSAGKGAFSSVVVVATVLAGVSLVRSASADAMPPLPVAETSSDGRSADAAAPLELDDVQLEGVTEGVRSPPAAGPRLEGLMLLHFADGFGAGGQLRLGAWGLRASVGYEPLVFIVDDDPQDRTFGDIEFSHSAQLNVDALLFTKSEIGGSIGYRYNTLLGHGVAVAFQSMFDLWGQRFSFSIPLMYFPDGTDRVREEHALSTDYRINFPFGANVQYGLGVAWVL